MQITMPLFVDPADVVTRMQIDDQLAGVTEVLMSAIVGAQLQVQALLESTLLAEDRDKLFFLDSDAFSAIQPGGVFRLELPSGFIRQDTPVILNYGRRWNLVNASTVDPTLVTIDYERGYVLLDAVAYHDQFVRVQCTTGFLTNVPTPAFTGVATPYSDEVPYVAGDVVTLVGTTYVALDQNSDCAPPNEQFWQEVTFGTEPLPRELYEAILSFVPLIFDGSQTTNRNADATKQYQNVADRGMLLLKRFFRVRGFSFRSLN